MAANPVRAITPPALPAVDRTRHHIAVRLLPFLFVLYIVNYLDRANLAYAALGMSRDLGFTGRVIGLGVGVFGLPARRTKTKGLRGQPAIFLNCR